MLLFALLPNCFACELIDSIRAKTIVAGLVFQTPEIRFGNFFDRDAETEATIWVGERESSTSTDDPIPVDNADVRITFAGNRLPVPNDSAQSGLYTLSSRTSADLLYAPATYVFEAKLQGEDPLDDWHGGWVEAPAALTTEEVNFAPAPTRETGLFEGSFAHPQGQSLTITWDPNAGRYAIVTIFRAGEETPVFDSTPATAGDAVRFIIGTPPTEVVVPGEVFQDIGLYAVVIFSADKGTPDANTFLGSPYIAGTGPVTLLKVGDVPDINLP